MEEVSSPSDQLAGPLYCIGWTLFIIYRRVVRLLVTLLQHSHFIFSVMYVFRFDVLNMYV